MSRTSRAVPRALIAAVVATALPLSLGAAPPRAQPSLRPNLGMQAAYDFSIVTSGPDRFLRFSTDMTNSGPGVLELYPRRDDCNGNGNLDDDRTAFQRVYLDANGDGYFTRGVDTRSSLSEVGCFAYNSQTGQWQFQDSARYDLLDLQGTTVGSNQKVAYCIIDDFHFDMNLPGSPGSRYFRDCHQNSITGISIGWADEYSQSVQGQSVSIDGVPNGVYCLRMTANPDHLLKESTYADNAAGEAVLIAGKNATDLERSC